MQPGPSRARRGETQFEYNYAPQIEQGVLSQGVVDDRSNWGDAPDQNEQIARAVNAPSEQQQAEAVTLLPERCPTWTGWGSLECQRLHLLPAFCLDLK